MARYARRAVTLADASIELLKDERRHRSGFEPHSKMKTRVRSSELSPGRRAVVAE